MIWITYTITVCWENDAVYGHSRCFWIFCIALICIRKTRFCFILTKGNKDSVLFIWVFAFGSSSASPDTQPLFNFSVWTAWPLNISLYQFLLLVKSVIPSTHTIFCVPSAVTHPRSIVDPPACFTLGKVFFSTTAPPFFLQNLLWWWPKGRFCFCQVQSTFFQRAQASQCFLLQIHKLNFVFLRSFFLLTLPCTVCLCCLNYVVLLSCEQLDLSLVLFFAAHL